MPATGRLGAHGVRGRRRRWTRTSSTREGNTIPPRINTRHNPNNERMRLAAMTSGLRGVEAVDCRLADAFEETGKDGSNGLLLLRRRRSGSTWEDPDESDEHGNGNGGSSKEVEGRIPNLLLLSPRLNVACGKGKALSQQRATPQGLRTSTALYEEAGAQSSDCNSCSTWLRKKENLSESRPFRGRRPLSEANLPLSEQSRNEFTGNRRQKKQPANTLPWRTGLTLGGGAF